MSLTWEDAARYMRYVAGAEPAERARLLLATYRGRPFVEALCGALTDESHARELERDGFLLLPEAVKGLVADEEIATNAHAGQAQADGPWREVYTFTDGHRLVFERHKGQHALWRLAERVPAPEPQAAGGGSTSPTIPTPPAAASTEAAARPTDAAPPSPTGGALPSAAGEAFCGVCEGADPWDGGDPFGGHRCSLLGPGSPEQLAAAAAARPVAEPMRADVEAVVAGFKAAQLTRQRRAAEEALRAGVSGFDLTEPERFLAAGLREPWSHAAPCRFCLRAVGKLALVLEVGAKREAAHEACARRAAEAHRDGAGRTAEVLRLELSGYGVQLGGGESFRQLQVAVLEARRRNALQVEWAKKPRKSAAKARDCALCLHPILKGEDYVDGGEERASHVPCASVLTERAA